MLDGSAHELPFNSVFFFFFRECVYCVSVFRQIQNRNSKQVNIWSFRIDNIRTFYLHLWAWLSRACNPISFLCAVRTHSYSNENSDHDIGLAFILSSLKNKNTKNMFTLSINSRNIGSSNKFVWGFFLRRRAEVVRNFFQVSIHPCQIDRERMWEISRIYMLFGKRLHGFALPLSLALTHSLHRMWVCVCTAIFAAASQSVGD